MSVIVFFTNIMLLLLLVWWLWKQPCLNSIRPYVLPALAFKLVCGVLVGLLYHHYYKEGDTITFKNASLILSSYAKQDLTGYIRLILFNEFSSESFRSSVPFSRLPNFSNSFFFIKLLSLFNLLTNSSYYLNALYLSLFSFWGTATLVTTLVKLEPKYKMAAVIAFLYFPSVVFWSSGVLKDSLIFGSMCWVIAMALELASGKRLEKLNWLLMPLLLYLFVRLKFFLALLLLPLLLIYLLVRITANKTKHLKSLGAQLVAVGLSACFFGVIGAWLVKEYNNAFFYRNLVYTYDEMLKLSVGQPSIKFTKLEPTLSSMLLNAPEALFGAIYRPFIWEAANNPLHLLMGFENLVILLLTIVAIAALLLQKKRLPTPKQLLFLLIILSFGVIIGLTTPNFGTLSRYRIAFLPFLVYLLLQSSYVQHLLQKLQAKPHF
ncbi:hypothetical protein ACFSRY_07065 [Pontibacter locisalis]|uniref:Glycosyltransferase RgtA/B/C/D-like domain-containing protein n=1 Tax=Pontibacter locisalis TaxID=1719035 RepID=A0ABW5IKF5_9BACT